MVQRLVANGAKAKLGLAFARAKLNQMRAGGMQNVSKAFKFMGMTVFVEINGQDEIIYVDGGKTAFYVSPDWSVSDPEKDDASFITPFVKGSKRGDAEKIKHGFSLPGPLNYWVSGNLKHTVALTNHRVVGFNGVNDHGGFYVKPGPTNRNLVKDGKVKQTTNQPFVAGVFMGKTVYVTFPAQVIGTPRRAEVFVCGGGDKADTQVATFDLGATGMALSDVTIDGDSALSRSIGTWTESEFPLTFIGTGCFTPDGKTIYLLCGTTGLKKPGSSYTARHTYAKKYVYVIYLSRTESGQVAATGSMWGSLGASEHRRSGASRVSGSIECYRINESTRTCVLSVYPVKDGSGYRPAALEVTLTDNLQTIGMDLVTSQAPVTVGQPSTVGFPRTGAGEYRWTSTAQIKADGVPLLDVSPAASKWVFDKDTWLANPGVNWPVTSWPTVIPELVSEIDSTTIVVDVLGYAPETQTLVYGLHTDRRVKEAGEELVSTRSVKFEASRAGTVLVQSIHDVSCADWIPQFTPLDPLDDVTLADRYNMRATGDYIDDVSVGIGHAFGCVSSPMVSIGPQIGVQTAGYNGGAAARKTSNLCAASIGGVSLVSLIPQCRPAGDYGYSEGNAVIKEVFAFTPDIPDGLESGRLILIDEHLNALDVTAKFLEQENTGNTAFPLISVSTYIGKTPKGTTP